jgi:predicted O-methyltransferase YrrM
LEEKTRSDIDALIKERDELRAHLERVSALLENVGYPPGHFYSPVVDVHDNHTVRAVNERLHRHSSMQEIVLDNKRVRRLMRELAAYYADFRFPRDHTASYRYYFDNPFFGVHDGLAYFAMLRRFRARRVIEVGCGFSSCLLLDTNDRFFDGSIHITLVDPFLSDAAAHFGADAGVYAHLVEQKLQDVPIEVFEALRANDILFIDSSHVAKTGSDVVHYLFEIFPRLRSGVLIHIHDILYPFEYLPGWVLEEKRSWNESYFVHAFLQYNAAFEIVYWTNYVFHRMREDLSALMPLAMENEGGSLWLRRL